MLKRLLTALPLLILTSCSVMQSDQFALPGTSITWRAVNEVVDEEIVQHSVKFRNTGSQIVSFDYTIVDDSNVPHVDAGGPNSGLVENLYPGAEVSVKNTWAHDDVAIHAGRITYGKRDSAQLAKTYKPWTVTPATSSTASATAGSPLLPLPEMKE